MSSTPVKVARPDRVGSDTSSAGAHGGDRVEQGQAGRAGAIAVTMLLVLALGAGWLRGTRSANGEGSEAGAAEERGHLASTSATPLRRDPAPLAPRDPDDDPAVARALGELVAKKPGSAEERRSAVRLTSHRATIRIAGPMARTEVDETFTNLTDEVLEGIYRFPIPPDAQIERLALEVDGKLIEGAFVERDRGAAIWRGAIVNAQPKARPAPGEDIVWVPGPWKDPALLEWQRGGRFELRVYPIPKRGSRRVVLAYTQWLAGDRHGRRYVYPLAEDPSGDARVDQFTLDVEVRGHATARGVRAHGYALERESRGAGVEARRLERQAFEPSGDLVVEYALPDESASVSAWSYAPESDSARAQARAGSLHAGSRGPDAAAPDGYVALALRPSWPAERAPTPKQWAIVVDVSRSMYGESYRRARRLVTRLVRDLGPEHELTVLACDVECRTLGGPPRRGGAGLASEVGEFLDGIEPDGGSDLAGAVAAALRAAYPHDGAPLELVLIGDGTPTVGPLRPGTLARAVQRTLPPDARVHAVALGSDSDVPTLRAVTRAGGGVMLPYVPGESVAALSGAIVEATQAEALRDVQLELPAGLVAPAPQLHDTQLSGAELLVTARLTEPPVQGEVVLRGRLGQRQYEQRFAVDITRQTDPSSAFVPRLYAAQRLRDLQLIATAEAKQEAVSWSTRFQIASPYTSLLVLESEAMFRAFGLNNARTAPVWTGEEALSSAEEELGWGGDTTSAEPQGLPAPEALTKKRFAADVASPLPAPTSAGRALEREAPALLPERRARRPLIPMRRVWTRTGHFDADRRVPERATSTALRSAELEHAGHADRRAALKQLYVLQALGARLTEASQVVATWTERDPLDPEALTARADLAARRGERARAIRLLGSVIDVRPGDVKALRRLARLHRWAGARELACRYQLTLAELLPDDVAELTSAVQCLEETGRSESIDELLAAAPPTVRARLTQRRAMPAAETRLVGDVRVSAEWSGGADLDLALLDEAGNRISWLGAPTRAVISATDVVSTAREGLALRGAAAGEYVVELVRTSGTGPVSGTLIVQLGTATRRVPFLFDDTRATLGIARVRLSPQLVPLR